MPKIMPKINNYKQIIYNYSVLIAKYLHKVVNHKLLGI